MNIYVGNLSSNSKETDLRSAFEQFGKVRNVNIIVDKYNGQSKGYGFVEMPSNNDAEKAIEEMNGEEFMGSTLSVNQARPTLNRRSNGRNSNSGNRR